MRFSSLWWRCLAICLVCGQALSACAEPDVAEAEARLLLTNSVWSNQAEYDLAETEPSAEPPLEAAWDEPYEAEGCCSTCGAAGGYGSFVPYGAACADPNWSFTGLFGYETFRGHPDGGWANYGLHAGFNFGTELGAVSDWTGIGFQLGATIGVYDWSGTDYRFQNTHHAETQGFYTYGFFRRATECSPWSGAVVHDWMFNDTFGVFGENPLLFQWRAQLGYAVSPWNEFGLWGAWRGLSDTQNVPVFGPTTWRPINQVNAYWHYKWGPWQPDTWLWVGVPERNRLTGGGSLGDYIAGARAEAPLSNRVSLYTLITYMHPSASPSDAGAQEEGWTWVIGLSFEPGPYARSKTVNGRRWTPLVPVATNGYFLVDASQIY